MQALARQADSSEQKDDSLDISREPETKKLKTDIFRDQAIDYKLEDKLSGILCCAVCLDVSSLSMYQVRCHRHSPIASGDMLWIYAINDYAFYLFCNDCASYGTVS